MTITLIAAMADNRVIGRENTIPWDLPEDRRRFRELTMGHPVLMGRKTFYSLPGTLDGRTVIVLSRNPEFTPPGTLPARTLQEALDMAEQSLGGDEVFIAGGGDLYRQALPLAHRICLTVVHREIQGDVTFPEIPMDRFTEICREELPGSSTATIIRLELRHNRRVTHGTA